jgi:glycosyltransferase involved in cell wall biosynthesis
VEDGYTLKMITNIRIGFVLPSGEWLGGRNYLRNLFAALRSVPENFIEPVIFTTPRVGDLSIDFPGVDIVRTSVLERKTAGWLARKVIARATSRDSVFERLLRRNGVTVLSHSFHLGQQDSIKTIAWIPDFQHVQLPELFTRQELQRRNKEYGEVCERCDKVIISSECARADLLSFAPKSASKVELLHFVASPVPLERAASLTSLQHSYRFHGDYFLLPNQFWKHKNHRVVLSALKILKRRKEPVLVLATGSTEDGRNPTYFQSIMNYATECEVLDCFRVLGKVPFDHLVGLMQHSTAFINPSHFEGWSTSVEEAKSMGKQIILSDLPVHREQSPDRAFFFPPDDAEALAMSMLAARRNYDLVSDQTKQERQRDRFIDRQKVYGNEYINIVKRTLEG